MRLREIVVDAVHPAGLARFWAEALDGFDIRPYDDAELTRLATLGLTPETDPSVMLDGPALKLCFQLAEPATLGRKRIHLDVESTDRVGDVGRLVSSGASVVEVFDSHTWLRDPEGNDFCVVDERS